MAGFPVSIVDLVRCIHDGGRLKANTAEAHSGFIFNDKVCCNQCGRSYEIKDGILDLFTSCPTENKLSVYEKEVRDDNALKMDHVPGPTRSQLDEMEVLSTLNNLDDICGKIVLELGSGTGRFTEILSSKCKMLLAVDFSRESLLSCRKRLRTETNNVGLIHADVCSLKLSPLSFDAVLSTLYSNLPTVDMRTRSTIAVYDALKIDGKYVLTAHHQEIRRVLKGIPPEGQYKNGIYYKYFTRRELKKELVHIFPVITFSTICTWMPYISRKKKWRVKVSRFCERVPLLNQLGELIVAINTKKAPHVKNGTKH